MPTQPWFVITLVVADVLVSLVLTGLLNVDTHWLTTLTAILVNLCTIALLLWIILYLRELGSRFLAAFTAMLGCDLLISTSLGVLMPLAGVLGGSAESLLFFAFLFWTVSVQGFIMHRTLEVSLGIGIGIAFGMYILSVAISQVAIGA